MSSPAASDFIRYLAAKKSLDDRSLNRQVWDALKRAVRSRPESTPLRVLELGCGIGTMLERLLAWGLLRRAAYTGIDVEAEFIREARQRLHRHASENRAVLTAEAEGAMLMRTSGGEVHITWEAADWFDFMEREAEKSAWDLLIAHAVLDLIDLDTSLPRLLSLLAPGGCFYFTLNFDGATILEPSLDPDLDQRIEALYHQTMDRRRHQGRPAGSSVAGRRLLRHLKEAGAQLAAAGSSDWVVFPGPKGYPGDEAFFLHFIIDTIGRALQGHPDLKSGSFQAWLERRHRQIDSAELIYIAHQLDVMGCI